MAYQSKMCEGLSAEANTSSEGTNGDISIDPSTVKSVVLQRLMEEVRVGDVNLDGYDRVHNRHNR